jgi:hypothetical protein
VNERRLAKLCLLCRLCRYIFFFIISPRQNFIIRSLTPTILLNLLCKVKSATYLGMGFTQSREHWRGRLSTVELIKVSCYVKMLIFFAMLKTDDINYLVLGSQWNWSSPSVRFPFPVSTYRKFLDNQNIIWMCSSACIKRFPLYLLLSFLRHKFLAGLLTLPAKKQFKTKLVFTLGFVTTKKCLFATFLQQMKRSNAVLIYETFFLWWNRWVSVYALSR